MAARRPDRCLSECTRASITVDSSESTDYLLNSAAWEVQLPLITAFALLALAFLGVLLLFCGLHRRSPYLLIPHIVMQVSWQLFPRHHFQFVAIVALLVALISALLALLTSSSIFYRLLNATPFTAITSENTVDLSTDDAAHVYATIAAYAALLLVELLFLVVIYRCYTHLHERRQYMQYCFEYSTPLRTVHVRVP